MSALRQLVAALWAALWVRWRLFAVRARGVFGERRAVVAGSGYYLGAGEIPVEGIDYAPDDLPPELAVRLDGARVELVDHARGLTARRARRRRIRRRRTASLAMAALLTLAVLGAGASALVTGSTGIPAVDRVLGIYEKNLEWRAPAGAGWSQQPDPSVESTSIEFSVGEMRMVSAWYLARSGDVCSLLTDAEQGSSGDLACVAPAAIVDGLDLGRGAVFNVTETSSGIVVRGYAASDVRRLEGSGPSGPLRFHLGDEWLPGVPGVDSIRPFIGFEAGARGDELSKSNYEVRAEMEDGSRLRIWPPE